MSSRLANTKMVYDPLWGIVNITDYLPMIDVAEFQALGFKYQLGITSLLFPSATHTRKQHSFGALKRTQALAERWVRRGLISNNDAKLIEAYALWHDIGHGPFSHVIEEVTQELWGRNHDENGALILERLKPAVEACNIPFDSFKKLFTHENPLYLAVHDKNLGTEKLDYLARDAYYTIGEAPGVEYLADHTYFIDNKVAIHEKAIDQAKSIQEFYVKMYKTVYLRKSSVISQRLVQKTTLEFLRTEPMKENDFWALTDFGLLGRFETAKSEIVRKHQKNLMVRNLPRTAVVIRPEKFATMETAQEKAQTTIPVPDEIMEKLTVSQELSSPSQIEKVEQEIAKRMKLPSDSIALVPPASLERFRPQDILITRTDGTLGKLSEYYPDHFQSLMEQGRAYTVLRVCTFDEHRETLSAPASAKAIGEYILSLAG